MRWNELFIFIAYLFATVDVAIAQTAKDSAIEDYMLCVRRAAIRFEPSGESPESIAGAATWACSREGTKAFNYLLRTPNPGLDPKGLQDTAKFVAIGQVVGVRLCKKTNDCDYGRMP
jgi:hypothetical protein